MGKHFQINKWESFKVRLLDRVDNGAIFFENMARGEVTVNGESCWDKSSFGNIIGGYGPG